MTISIKYIPKIKLTASLPFALLRDAFGMRSGSGTKQRPIFALSYDQRRT